MAFSPSKSGRTSPSVEFRDMFRYRRPLIYQKLKGSFDENLLQPTENFIAC